MQPNESSLTPVLETPRLVLREMGIADLDFVASMLADPEVMRFWPRCYTREEAEAWIRKQQGRYAKDGFGYWLAVEKATAQPVGQAGLMITEIDGIEEPAVGYIIHRPFWRRGFATEAAAAILEYALHTLGWPRVICPIRPENLPSQAVARKIGLKPDKRTLFAGFEHVVFATTQGPARPVAPIRKPRS